VALTVTPTISFQALYSVSSGAPAKLSGSAHAVVAVIIVVTSSQNVRLVDSVAALRLS
jgi:hypothetical protein